MLTGAEEGTSCRGNLSSGGHRLNLVAGKLGPIRDRGLKLEPKDTLLTTWVRSYF